MNEQEFIESLKSLNIDLNSKTLSKLNTYCNYLLEYNTHTNLTAIKTKEEVYLKHFYDSLTITKIADLTKGKILQNVEECKKRYAQKHEKLGFIINKIKILYF